MRFIKEKDNITLTDSAWNIFTNILSRTPRKGFLLWKVAQLFIPFHRYGLSVRYPGENTILKFERTYPIRRAKSREETTEKFGQDSKMHFDWSKLGYIHVSTRQTPWSIQFSGATSVESYKCLHNVLRLSYRPPRYHFESIGDGARTPFVKKSRDLSRYRSPIDRVLSPFSSFPSSTNRVSLCRPFLTISFRLIAARKYSDTCSLLTRCNLSRKIRSNRIGAVLFFVISTAIYNTFIAIKYMVWWW